MQYRKNKIAVLIKITCLNAHAARLSHCHQSFSFPPPVDDRAASPSTFSRTNTCLFCSFCRVINSLNFYSLFCTSFLPTRLFTAAVEVDHCSEPTVWHWTCVRCTNYTRWVVAENLFSARHIPIYSVLKLHNGFAVDARATAIIECVRLCLCVSAFCGIKWIFRFYILG